jgi:hypothetical protein
MKPALDKYVEQYHTDIMVEHLSFAEDDVNIDVQEVLEWDFERIDRLIRQDTHESLKEVYID